MRTPKLYSSFKCLIEEKLFFSPRGDHGVGHTKRVLYLSSVLAGYYDLTESEERVLALACCYHDIGRTNSYVNPRHGKDSADKVLQWYLLDDKNLTTEEEELVLKLITEHCLDDENFVGTEREVLLYQIIKDADALDRVRFNDLDPKYLRLNESKTAIGLAELLVNEMI